MNTIDNIREQLGFPPFQKIDPNTQEIPELVEDGKSSKTGQATITAVLTAMYQQSRTNEGFNLMLNKDKNIPWSDNLFGNDAENVVERISQYVNESKTLIKSIIEDTGNTAWHTAANSLEGQVNFETFSKFFSGMRNDLLHYLPPALQLGTILNDSSFDDRTNKMEGPVSGFMHKIEKIFSEPQKA